MYCVFGNLIWSPMYHALFFISMANVCGALLHCSHCAKQLVYILTVCLIPALGGHSDAPIIISTLPRRGLKLYRCTTVTDSRFHPITEWAVGWPALRFRPGAFEAGSRPHKIYYYYNACDLLLKTALSLFSVYPDFLIYYLYCCPWEIDGNSGK